MEALKIITVIYYSVGGRVAPGLPMDAGFFYLKGQVFTWNLARPPIYFRSSLNYLQYLVQ